MNTHNFESTTVVDVNYQSEQIIADTVAGGTDQVKQETQALIDAIRKRAQFQAKSTSILARESYLNDMRRARTVIESQQMTQHNGLEDSWLVLQQEVERNWHLLMKEAVDLSHRCQKAGLAAWEEFNRV